ncbi:bul2p [Saccharomyces arboricola H-6]|uniref:Bul2p n=1 Tax=Saccharomyces arboricola (strain H-6 / AS 2.3317 / CBS 10644) TaxID=1160507 RepID=J8PYN9_SACAR|nr:bul2p [Saccharomyces arboricola H-6]
MTFTFSTSSRKNGRPPLKSVSTEDNIHLLRKRRQQQLPRDSTEASRNPNSNLMARAIDNREEEVRSASTTNLDRLRQEQEENSLEMGYTKSPQSHRANILVDVLPSFEMYNALHRHIPQGNVDPDRHDFPPSYQEVRTQRMTILPSTDHSVERSELTAVPGSENACNSANTHSLTSLHPLQTQHLTINTTVNGEQPRHSLSDINVSQIAFEDDLNDSDNVFIDKLYSLPKLTTPIEIDIRITKTASIPHLHLEEQSILKEYTSGDIIHGYCLIENRSSQPLKFEMFYVTLEAYISVIDRQKGKRTLKRFLRMVDLSASWSYTNITPSTGVNIVPGERDFDDAIIGLSNSRELKPNTKYKKFFMFKLPTQLLDVTCKQEQFSHCLLPPSFGIDKYKNNCKYSGIKVNSVLGCGHLGTKGSPILTLDMADDNLSINYTIDAKIVGKDKKTSKLNIMKEREYNLRIMPFPFAGVTNQQDEKTCLRQLNDLERLIEDRVEALDKVFKKLESDEAISNLDIHDTDISGSLDGNEDLDSDEILRRKMDQLHVNNRIDDAANQSPSYDSKNMAPKENLVETELRYKFKNKNKSNASLFSHFLGSSETGSSSGSPHTYNSGLIVLSVKKPQSALPYWSPSLLRKTNKFEAKSEQEKENWERLMNMLPDGVKKPLTKLDVNLACIQSNNSAEHKPPEISSVTTEFVVITAKSDCSIPIKFSPELLMNENRLNGLKIKFSAYQKKVQEYRKKFEDNYARLNELYNKNRDQAPPRELLFTNFISDQINNDIDSLAGLRVNVTDLHDIFKRQIHTFKEENEDIISKKEGNNPSSASSSNSNFLQATFSNGASTATKFTQQIVHEWEKVKPLQYKRNVTVNLKLNPNIKETLVPNFETCLCCRFYCIRVNIKFDNHLGSMKVDVPVDVKKLQI